MYSSSDHHDTSGIFTNIHICSKTCILSYCLGIPPPPYAGSAESDVGVPVGEKILGFHNKGVPGKNIYTKSTNVIVSCRETCARSERVNLYERQIMILQRKTKTYAMSSGSGPPSEMSGPGNLYRLSLVSSTPSICSDVDTVLSRGASSHNDRY